MAKITKKINSGAALWNAAKELIPGGNQLLSKRAEMFLPGQWPAYYKKAKGCEIWDLDDNHYYDTSIMGIGTCPLGYANDEVSAAVKNAVDEGSMSTLNCPEEVRLAQELVRLHPWAGMARFARTGGEACAIAVRIARAFSKKEKVAFCGYHGWHDWYLSANLSDGRRLDQLLLAGLSPVGVPPSLKETALTFSYGDIGGFEKLIAQHGQELGVIIMEVARHSEPDIKFVTAVAEVAAAKGIVLIFDEISSGFRLNTGGVHLLYNVSPDIVVLGKALGNGHPIAAVIGRKPVMQAAQETFISSSYWTERVGFAAALAVLKIFERDRIAEQLVAQGRKIHAGLKEVIGKNHLNIGVEGLASNPILSFKGEDGLMVKTLYTQEMLKRGFLAGATIYVCTAHTDEVIGRFLSAAGEVFGLIAAGIRSNQLAALLEGPVCHSGFKRLN